MRRRTGLNWVTGMPLKIREVQHACTCVTVAEAAPLLKELAVLAHTSNRPLQVAVSDTLAGFLTTLRATDKDGNIFAESVGERVKNFAEIFVRHDVFIDKTTQHAVGDRLSYLGFPEAIRNAVEWSESAAAKGKVVSGRKCRVDPRYRQQMGGSAVENDDEDGTVSDGSGGSDRSGGSDGSGGSYAAGEGDNEESGGSDGSDGSARVRYAGTRIFPPLLLCADSLPGDVACGSRLGALLAAVSRR
jgi:uncharacterized membrane protein YgcG